MGLRKSKRHYCETDAPTTSDCLVRILVRWHYWEFWFPKIEEDDIDDIWFQQDTIQSQIIIFFSQMHLNIQPQIYTEKICRLKFNRLYEKSWIESKIGESLLRFQ